MHDDVRRIFVGGVLLLWVGVSGVQVARSQTFTPLLNNGPTDSHINIVFLAEGYTGVQQADFLDDADDILDYLVSVPPYEAYTTYFNAYAIFVASAESGSDHPSNGQYVDTYFNSSYDSNGITRLVTIPPNSFDGNWANGRGKAFSLLASLIPDYDIPILVVNDVQYGGSGGSIAITSTNSAAPDIAVHEIGHSFADLSDEYSSVYPGWTPFETANSTAHTVREEIVWNPWIDAATPVPTVPAASYPNEVGLFEGAQYQTTGWYRPSFNCAMRSLGVVFCEVCREQHVGKIYDLVSTVLSVDPSTASLLVLTAGETQELSVVPRATTSYALEIQWYRDGVAIPGETGETYTVDADALADGQYHFSVRVTDNSSLVRLPDIQSKLEDEEEWSIEIDGTELPVDIVGFRIVQNNEQIELSWTALGSSEGSGFAIESSVGQMPFETITFVPSKVSTATTRSTYHVVVDAPGIGRYRFRLRHVDGDGTRSYSRVITLDLTMTERVRLSRVAPNPFSDRVSMRLETAEEQMVEIEIYDMIGRLRANLYRGLVTANESRELSFSVAALESGPYVLVIAGERFRETRIITKR